MWGISIFLYEPLIYICEVPVYSYNTLDNRCGVFLYTCMNLLFTYVRSLRILILLLITDVRSPCTPSWSPSVQRFALACSLGWTFATPRIRRSGLWTSPPHTGMVFLSQDPALLDLISGWKDIQIAWFMYLFFYIIGIISVPVSIKLPLAGESSFCKALEAKVRISPLVWWNHCWWCEINVWGLCGLPLPTIDIHVPRNILQTNELTYIEKQQTS